MNKYSGTLLLTALFLLFGYAIIQTLPSKTVSTEFGEIPVVENQALPLASIANPECQFNDPDLFLIQPKVYQSVSGGSVDVVGQAVGAFENTVVIEVKNNETGAALSTDSVIVEPNYPCTFEKEIGVGNLEAGTYLVRASFSSPNDGSVLKEVEVPIQIE